MGQSVWWSVASQAGGQSDWGVGRCCTLTSSPPRSQSEVVRLVVFGVARVRQVGGREVLHTHFAKISCQGQSGWWSESDWGVGIRISQSGESRRYSTLTSPAPQNQLGWWSVQLELLLLSQSVWWSVARVSQLPEQLPGSVRLRG